MTLDTDRFLEIERATYERYAMGVQVAQQQIAQLRAENAALRQMIERLQKENAEAKTEKEVNPNGA